MWAGLVRTPEEVVVKPFQSCIAAVLRCGGL